MIAPLAARVASAADPVLPIDPGSSELRPIIERYSANLETLNRTYPLRGSEERQRQLEQFYTRERVSLDAVNFNLLGRTAASIMSCSAIFWTMRRSRWSSIALRKPRWSR